MQEIRKVTLPNEELLSEVARLIARGQHVRLRVRGNSMNPFFVDRRDEVVLSPFDREDLIPGKIILARDKYHRFVLHRIIKITSTYIILMGDGNIKGTEDILYEDVVGIVTSAIRNNKEIRCEGVWWDFFSSTWKYLLPVRRWLLAIWRRL